MTIKSWRNIYSPSPVEEVPAVEATSATRRLFEGLSKRTAHNHGLEIISNGRGLFLRTRYSSPQSGRQAVDILGMMSLCHHHCIPTHQDVHPCHSCPLYKARNGWSCYDERPDERKAPLSMTEITPLPMIAWLRATEALLHRAPYHGEAILYARTPEGQAYGLASSPDGDAELLEATAAKLRQTVRNHRPNEEWNFGVEVVDTPSGYSKPTTYVKTLTAAAIAGLILRRGGYVWTLPHEHMLSADALEMGKANDLGFTFDVDFNLEN